MASEIDLLHCFEQCGRLYRARFLAGAERKFPRLREDPLDALAFFLDGYAFERQGASPDYKRLAVEAAESVGELAPQAIWDCFLRLLGTRKPNTALNPLAPKETGFCWRGQPRQTDQASVVELVVQGDCPGGIVHWARDGMAQGRTLETFQALRSVTGIGEKIASFFLRDVATLFGLEVDRDDRHLLQPIGVWVGRAARALWPELPTDWGVWRRAIVQHSLDAGVNPERVNQGMWYFATQVCRSKQPLFDWHLQHGTAQLATDEHAAAFEEAPQGEVQVRRAG